MVDFTLRVYLVFATSSRSMGQPVQLDMIIGGGAVPTPG